MAQNNFIVDLIASLKKTQSKQQIKADIKALRDLYVKLIGNLDMPKTRKNIKNQLKRLNNNFFTITPTVNSKGVRQAIKQAVTQAQKVANSNKIQYSFEMDKAKFQNQLKNFARANSKLFTSKEMTMKYNQLVDSAGIAKSKSELKGLRSQLSAFRTELIATNKAGMTWTDKFKASISHFAQYFSGASFIYAMTRQLRNAWTEVKTLDDRLVDLQKVTSEIENRDSLYKYFDKALNKANELNVKVDSLIYAITEFKKLGWSLSDAELGGKWATMLSNVGDVNIDTAIGSIKTAIASFDEIGGYGNDQMDKKLEAYTDLINNMSNKYSIDAEGLAEAIRLSAGTLTEANTSIEQAATMFATANKYYNDPDYLGNTAKIGSLRMRATTGDEDAIEELSEMGEDVEEVTALTGKLREELIALTGVDIMVDNNTFKSYYDQLYEISQVIDELDDTTSAKVLEMMFGKNRAAAGMSLLSGMQESEKAYTDAINSAGSATEEYETWMQSADAATQRFSNSLTEMYQSILNGNTVRDLANMGSIILDFANSWGIVEGAVKGFLALKIGTLITNGAMAFVTATKQVEQYGKALQLANNIPNGNLAQRYSALKSIAQATSSLTTAQLKQVLSSQSLTQADRIRILQMQGMTREMATQKLAELSLTQATNAQTAATASQTASTFSLKSAMVGLGATMKSVFLSNPVGIALMAVSIGVSAVTSAISNHNQKMEEMRDKAKEAAETANTLGDEISNLASKYISLSEAVKTDASAKEDLMTTQTELLKKLGLEGESIDDLIAKYGSLSNAIKQASIDSLKNSQIDLLAGVNAAKEELLEIGKDGFWGGNNIIDATGEDAVKAFKELKKAGIVDSGSFGTGGGALVLIGDDSTTEGILENYERLEKALEALRDSNAFTQQELSNNSLFQAIYSRYNELKDEVDAYNSAIDNLNENLAQQIMLTALQGSKVPKTEEDFESFRDELVKTAIASEQFIGNEEEITDAINNYLSTVPEFEGYYSIPLENELDKVNALLDQEDFSKIMWDFSTSITELDTIKDKLSELDKTYAKLFDSPDDNISISFEDYSSIFNAFKDVEGLDISNFVQQLQDAGQNTEQVTSVMEDLIGAYLDCSGVLDNVTEENKDFIITMLEEMGVVNAEEIVLTQLNAETERLSIEKEFLSKCTTDLANVTMAEIEEFASEYSNAQAVKEELASLALAKQTVNGTSLDFSGDISNLISYMETLNASTYALEAYNKVKNGANGMPSNVVETLRKQAEKDVQNAINSAKSYKPEINKVKIDPKYEGSSSTQKAIDAASESAKKASESTKNEFEELFDFFERRIKVLDNSLSLLKSNLENITGSFAKNQIIDAEVNINAEKVNNYTDALAMYTEKANEALSKLPSDIAQKIKDGAIDLTTFIGSGNESVVEAIKDYEQWSDSINECKLSIGELQQELEDLELQKFSNIIEDFSNQFDIREKGKDLIDQTKEWIESSGQLVGDSFFSSQIEQSKKQLMLFEQEKAELVEQMNSALASGRVKTGSEAFLSMIDSLSEVEGSILDVKTELESLDTELQNLHFEVFDKVQDNFNNLHSEIDNLVSLFDDIDVADDNGNWSKEALSNLGLLAQKMELAKYQVNQYGDEITKLNQDYLNGKYSLLEYQEKLAELSQEQWSAIDTVKSVENAIVELNEVRVDEIIEGIEEEISAYEELTDAQLEALQAEKDLHDYRKSIEEKTGNLESLQRQRSALELDTSQAAKAKKALLDEQIKEAQDDLTETEYDHSIEQQRSALESQFEAFEKEKNDEIESLRNSLNERELLISQSFESVKANADIVGQQIAYIAQQHGITVSNALMSSWQSGENAIASYGAVLSAQSSAFIGNIIGVENEVWNLQAQANNTANSLAWMFSTRADNLVNELTGSYYAESNLNTMTNALHDSLVNTLERGYDVSNITSAFNSIADSASKAADAWRSYHNAANGDTSSGDYELVDERTGNTERTYSSESDAIKQARLWNEDIDDDEPGYYVRNKNGKVLGIGKYAKGVHNLKRDELAWTQDKGREVILSPSRDAILTPLKQGDTVLTKIQTDNIFDWSKFNPADFIQPSLNLGLPKLPEIINRNAKPNVNMHYDSLVTINGDVNDTNHFIKQVTGVVERQLDKSFNDFKKEIL